MAEIEQVTFFKTMSILGYCMLPTLGLAALNIFISLNGWAGFAMAFVVVLWCVYSSTTFFEVALCMPAHRWLIAYPVSMFYACFGAFCCLFVCLLFCCCFVVVLLFCCCFGGWWFGVLVVVVWWLVVVVLFLVRPSKSASKSVLTCFYFPSLFLFH